jgi:hypothetical protein
MSTVGWISTIVLLAIAKVSPATSEAPTHAVEGRWYLRNREVKGLAVDQDTRHFLARLGAETISR